MKKLSTYIILVFSCIFTFAKAQDGFSFANSKKDKVNVNFDLNSNLIIIPVELNDIELTFILDTGATNTILFNISDVDSLQIKNTRKIKIKGLGSSEPVEAIHSQNNKLKIGKLINHNQDLCQFNHSPYA